MANISTDELKTLSERALVNAGLREQDAAIVADHYWENELSGKASHGMVRVIEAVKSAQKNHAAQQDAEIEHDSGSLLRFNAKSQNGAVAGHTAMTESIKRAKEHGIALVGIHNYIASSGSMAYYLRRFVDEGLIAFMGCNSIALVSPPGSKERMIGTNPIGVCMPGENGQHLIADLATSAYAYGKIMVHKAKGEPVPEGVMIDETGSPSTNPEDADDGAILPLAGYKGFSLGLMIELMAGPLIGAKAIKKDLCDEDGLFIIAIDPKAMGHAPFYKDIAEALSKIKNAERIPGIDHISVAGERSASTLHKNLAAGEIDVADTTLEKLRELAK
ncbi:MAG: Ldh family oxidoreductase [Alphaproteobacteria bacterium]|nr:Ldh family oxidoreductase [Alphaproteobacteria bacterium]